MTLAYHIPALSTSNLPHVDPYTSCWDNSHNFLSVPHPAHSLHLPWSTISNLHNLDHVHQVCAVSCGVGCSIECSMTVVIHPGSCCTLTAPSISHIRSLTWIVLWSFVCNFVFIAWLKGNRQDDIAFLGCQSMGLKFWNNGMAYPTVAHAQTNVSCLTILSLKSSKSWHWAK